MDQLKEILRHLKRIHFWIICPLVVAIGIGAWFLAIGKLNEEKENNVSNIEGNFSQVRSVSSVSPHPNANVAGEMEKLITKTREEIKKAWENKVAQQAEVLTWPDFPWPAARKETFLRTVQPLRPIERYVKVEEDGRHTDILNLWYLDNYRDYIWQELPKLAELAGAAWVVRADDSSNIPGNADERQANTIVYWEPASQKSILDKHFPWKSRSPSALQILYAQEDLWVLRHLMQIISRTNENATTRHSAAVRKILDIKIGKDAVYSDVTVTDISEEGGGTSRPTTQSQQSQDANAIPDPAEGRYVDKNYEPLSAEILRQVMEHEGDLDPEQAYLAVAKRIPLRMRVSIDQRHINRLLVECANSELTVEVRQLMINPDFTPARSRAAGGSGGFAEVGFGGPRNANATQESASQFPFDLDVELYGIVSIYNPVDQTALGLESEEGGEEEDSARSDTDTFLR